jgi:hypothetical protein
VPVCRLTIRLSTNVSWNEFLNGLKGLEEELRSASKSFLADLDRTSYKLLINGLKSSDPDAVKLTIDQLVAEKKPVAIPPIYFVSVAHPVPWVRQQATAALPKMVPPDELKKLTEGKDIKTAVGALIEKYGHYRG